MNAIEIARTALDVEMRRMEVIANNFANAQTTRTADGGLFQPLRLVSGPKASFADHLARGADPLTGVSTLGLEPVRVAPRRVHEPGHPDADADGYVTYPGFDQGGEMVQLIVSARTYEANVVALNIARQTYAKALEIGRR